MQERAQYRSLRGRSWGRVWPADGGRRDDVLGCTYDIQFRSGGGNVPGSVITNGRIDKSNNLSRSGPAILGRATVVSVIVAFVLVVLVVFRPVLLFPLAVVGIVIIG
jgi:hypothetical protein